MKKSIAITTIAKTLTSNTAYVRAYGENGKTITSKRGQAILEMLSFVKNDSLLKAHKRYKRKNKGAVSYIRFSVFVNAFRDIIHTSHGKKLIMLLDTMPSITYQSVIKNASDYKTFLDSAGEVMNRVA
jgi:hypothetical protein